MIVELEFDSAKDAATIAKHGVSLGFGAGVFEDVAMILIATERVEDGERRFRAIGRVDGKLWTAVHVMRGDAVRFISVRRSNESEERSYRTVR